MRTTRDEYYMAIAELTAKRSTCDRANVGAIAIKDKRIIMSGYNGSPSGIAHCNEVGHMLHNGHCIATVHAEQNIIANAAKHGISLEGCTIYVTHQPCFYCLKLLISAGVKYVIYKNSYYDNLTPESYYKLIHVSKYKEPFRFKLRVSKEEADYNASIDGMCSHCGAYADMIDVENGIKLCTHCYKKLREEE